MGPAVGRARRGRGRGRRRADPRRAAAPFAVVDVRRRRRELHGLGAQPPARRGRDVRRPPGPPAHRGARDHVRRRDAARGGLAVEVGAARVRRPRRCSTSTGPAGRSAASRRSCTCSARSLSFLFAARLFGHWTWGLAAGLLWAAAPGLTAMSIQLRPDVPLAVSDARVRVHGRPRSANDARRSGTPRQRRPSGSRRWSSCTRSALLPALVVAALWKPADAARRAGALRPVAAAATAARRLARGRVAVRRGAAERRTVCLGTSTGVQLAVLAALAAVRRRRCGRRRAPAPPLLRAAGRRVRSGSPVPGDPRHPRWAPLAALHRAHDLGAGRAGGRRLVRERRSRASARSSATSR